VLSSVHTNNATEAVLRLLELDVPAYLAAAALRGIVSQRLVRRLCRRCRRACVPAASDSARIGLPPPSSRDRFFQSAGCSSCRSGFDGRLGIFETLTVDSTLRRRITAHDDCVELEQEAFKSGALLPLREAAHGALRSGETTIAEAASVLPPLAAAV
jgi:type II secretory ATPase GspE/PulE/Tfp pilus assembly ATPase PilB-like protein